MQKKSKIVYVLSLPERFLRTISILTGSFFRDIAELTLPDIMKGTKTYRIFVIKTSDYLVKNLGGMDGKSTVDKKYPVRKTIGNFLETISILAVGLSPIWILLALADLSSGSKKYFREITKEMRKRKIISMDSKIENIDGFLEVVEKISGDFAESIDMPPLSKEEIRKRMKELQKDVKRKSKSQKEIDAKAEELFSRINETAKEKNISMLYLSGIITLKTASLSAEVTGRMLKKSLSGIIDDYAEKIESVRKTGIRKSLFGISKKYAGLASAYRKKKTRTEKVLGKYLE